MVYILGRDLRLRTRFGLGVFVAFLNEVGYPWYPWFGCVRFGQPVRYSMGVHYRLTTDSHVASPSKGTRDEPASSPTNFDVRPPTLAVDELCTPALKTSTVEDAEIGRRDEA